MKPWERRRIAFYAPMKPPNHPTPSGDRRIARLLMRAFAQGGWEFALASTLRTRQSPPDDAAQKRLIAKGAEIAAGLVSFYRESGARPALWFTYHCYYKAPDLIGPAVAKALSIPYVVAEGYRAKKRLTGPYARFAAISEAALDQADIIFPLQPRGLDALERDRPAAQRIIPLPPFTETGAEPLAKPAADGPLRLITIAMMREGDKLASYRALAAALRHMSCDWRLDVIGDGAARAEVEAAFADVHENCRWLGRIDDPAALRSHLEGAELFLWPGVNEAFGMVYLEAQAAGLACIAEDRPGVRDVIAPSGRLAPPGDARAFAASIDEFARSRGALAVAGREARDYVKSRHGVAAAARALSEAMESLL